MFHDYFFLSVLVLRIIKHVVIELLLNLHDFFISILNIEFFSFSCSHGLWGWWLLFQIYCTTEASGKMLANWGNLRQCVPCSSGVSGHRWLELSSGSEMVVTLAWSAGCTGHLGHTTILHNFSYRSYQYVVK